jgi:hypothetical protein
VICPKCGYQNVFIEEELENSDLKNQNSFVDLVEGFSSHSEGSMVQLEREAGAGVEAEPEANAKWNEPKPKPDQTMEPQVESEPVQSPQVEEVAQRQDAFYETPDVTLIEDAQFRNSKQADIMSDTQSMTDLDYHFDESPISHQDSKSALDELVDFGNSDQVLGSQILFNIVIREINLKEEKDLVFSVIKNLHIDESQVELWLNQGEVEIKKISAARMARIIKNLGSQDVQYDAYQVSI